MRAVPESVTGVQLPGHPRERQSGKVGEGRDRMLVGKERHDLGRPQDVGYPVRAIRTPEFLYVHNYEPDRWPVGNPETDYPNCDNSPTKTLLTSQFDEFYRLNFGKRPREELYRITDDPSCVKNLAGEPSFRKVKEQLRDEMEAAAHRRGRPPHVRHGLDLRHV